MSPIANRPAPAIPYFTPAQTPASGTGVADDNGQLPSLFQPLTIRGTTFQNRIWLSPLCQYSAQDGKLTFWHKAHLGGIISRGPGLSIIEATAVSPEGRITPEDSGIWSDEHIGPLQEIVRFAHSQNQKIGIQLAHAGRKASTTAPWLSFSATAGPEVGGWPDDVLAPSAVPHSDTYPHPKEMTKAQIKDLVGNFVRGARRALAAGFDVIEIHNAHGYLLHEFLSPESNKRTDEYGGSFENRVRLTLEVVDAVRAVIPQDMPLFLRISASDWLEHLDQPSWRIEDTIKLSGLLIAHGVDLLDVSSSGISPKQVIKGGPTYQAGFSHAVKEAYGDKLLVSAVGSITDGHIAQGVLDAGQADAVFVGRMFQKNPGLVWSFAEDLGVKVKVANQIEWAFYGRGTVAPKTSKI